MKINSELGYEPVTYSELTQDEAFWAGCKSCVNYDILMSKERKNCMCTAMLYDPKDHYEPEETKEFFEKKKQCFERLLRIKQWKLLKPFFKDDKDPTRIRTPIVAAKPASSNLFFTTFLISKNNFMGRWQRKSFWVSAVDLDTSYCVKYLSEDQGYEVHSIIVNTGGFTDEELKEVEEHAYKLGVKTHTTVNAVKGYYDQIIKYLIYGNVLKNNTYPLSVSAERLSQALHIAEHVKKLNADAVAHGSTGAGNDQVRFDMIFHIMIPGVEIITPIRDLKLSREAGNRIPERQRRGHEL